MKGAAVNPDGQHNPYLHLRAAPPTQVRWTRRAPRTTAWIVSGVAVVAVVASVLYWVLVFRQGV